MTLTQIEVRPVNSILGIEDIKDGDVPEFVPHVLAYASSSFIMFSTYAEVDGPTDITIGSSSELALGRAPDLTFELLTPSRAIKITTVDEEVVFQSSVASEKTPVAFWFSHPVWPEKIWIGID